MLGFGRTLTWTVLAISAAAAAACGAGGGGDKLSGGNDGNSGGPNGGGGESNGGGNGAGGTQITDVGNRGPDGGCNALTVGFEEINPTVVLLIDRSGSMWDASYGSVPTRWQALFDALVHPQQSPILALEDKVRWGFTAYTADGAKPAGVECPILDQVPIRFGNFADIQAEYTRLSTVGRPTFKAETPTGESLNAVADQLAAFNEPGPKFIVVATDGEPDDCRVNDPQCGQDLAIGAAQRAYGNGIVTFVIGIGNEVGDNHLRDLANAGRGLPVAAPSGDFINVCLNGGYATQTATYAGPGETPGNAPFYHPEDPAALEAALREIIQSVRTCNFELNAEVDLNRAFEGSVVLDDVDLQYDAADGWRMVNETQLEIVGEACTRILTESRRIEISFPCDVAVFIQ